MIRVMLGGKSRHREQKRKALAPAPAIQQECFRCRMRRSLLTDQSKLANHGHGKAKGI
jgi:hypothetical protein